MYSLFSFDLEFVQTTEDPTGGGSGSTADPGVPEETAWESEGEVVGGNSPAVHSLGVSLKQLVSLKLYVLVKSKEVCDFIVSWLITGIKVARYTIFNLVVIDLLSFYILK